MTIQLWVLEILLFMTAIIVNGAGSLEAVVKATENVQGQSVEILIRRLPDLPATSQVALVLVPVAALIIPIGTVAAGEGLATLVLERRSGDNAIGLAWHAVAAEVEYNALRDAAINTGADPGSAKNWAAQITGYRRPSAVRAELPDSAADRPQSVRRTASGRSRTRVQTRQMDARLQVRAYLAEHPEAVAHSVRDLADEIGVSKSIVAEEKAALYPVRLSNNGHGEPRE